MKELEEVLKEFEAEIMEMVVKKLSKFGKEEPVSDHKALTEITQKSSVSKEENDSKN